MTTQKIDLNSSSALKINKESSELLEENRLKDSADHSEDMGDGKLRKQYSSLINELNIFQNISDNFRNKLLNTSNVVQYSKGRNIFLEGQKPEQIYIVLEGCVKLYKGNASGDESIIQMMTKGDLFLTSAVFLNAIYPVFAQATKKTTVLTVSASIIRNFARENNDFAFNLLQDISKNSQSMIQHVENVRLKSATERVGWFLLKLLVERSTMNDYIEIPYSKSSLASFLDMKPETLSRTLKQFKSRGMEISKSSIVLPSPNALCNFCDTDISANCSRHGTPDCPNPDCIPDKHIWFK